MVNIQQTRSCYQCNGAGKRRCVVCLGPGQLPCKTCLARGQLKLSLQLTVTWKLYKSDRIVERTVIPEPLIRAVQGRVAFEEDRAAIWPINFFPDEAVNYASRELLDEHRARCTSEKVILQVKLVPTVTRLIIGALSSWLQNESHLSNLQRQSVRMIPVYQVAYAWRNERGYFYIYGHDNLVYFPNYPQKVCCGLLDLVPCSLL